MQKHIVLEKQYLKTRKFKCKNPQCNRKVFSEQTPYILRYSRRTKRVSKILDSLSVELTGKQGSMLSKELDFLLQAH